jgi:ribosomal protein L40E
MFMVKALSRAGRAPSLLVMLPLGAMDVPSRNGVCEVCGAPNSFDNVVCDSCGARLPWVNSLVEKEQQPPLSKTTLRPAEAQPAEKSKNERPSHEQRISPVPSVWGVPPEEQAPTLQSDHQQGAHMAGFNDCVTGCFALVLFLICALVMLVLFVMGMVVIVMAIHSLFQG